MEIIIKNINGRWTCNGKPYIELSFSEMVFFDEFLRSVRLEQLVKSQSIANDPNFQKPIKNIDYELK